MLALRENSTGKDSCQCQNDINSTSFFRLRLECEANRHSSFRTRKTSMTPLSKTVIFFATRWGAQFGGINSFNQDLVSAFSAVCYEQVNTVCVVLTASEQEIGVAMSESQVHLISLDADNQPSFVGALEPAIWERLTRLDLVVDTEQLVWVGHDRITGAIALEASKKRGGRSALIHHMSYSRYETFAENTETAQRKIDEQKNLFRNADITFAVGPFLRDALSDILGHDGVSMLVPGLAEIAVRNPPKTFKGFLSGRLSEDARRIKQAHLGIAAFGDAIRQANDNVNLPVAFRSKNEPMLTLRGVNFENLGGANTHDDEGELKAFSEQYAKRAFTLHALPYTTDREKLYDDLSSASVAMMPSWHEGFGLVAWEAIAAGVPVIVSDKSGAYRLLEELEGGLYKAGVTSIDVAGSNIEPYFLAADVAELSSKLMSVASDVDARKRAVCLREALLRFYTWADCAKSFATALSLEVLEVSQRGNGFAGGAKVLEHHEPSIMLLELPQSTWHPEAGLSDSQMLRAEEAMVPFDISREPFLDAQVAWAMCADPIIAVRLLTGAGGVGKTRLGLELCHRLKKHDWQVGFISGECQPGQAIQLGRKIVGRNKNSCVVIDYAETRQPVLLALLKSLLLSNTKYSVRVLLLARDGGDWWASLPGKDVACEALLDGPATSGPYMLPMLHDSIRDRQMAYYQALKIYSTHLGVSAPEHRPALIEEHFARPLYIQMAALITLRGERPKSAEALPRALVNHERRYWGGVLTSPHNDSEEQMRQAALLMTLATLYGGLFLDRTLEDIWVSIGEQKADLRRLFKALTPLYSERERLQGLRPDLIGEALVAQTLLQPEGTSFLSSVLAAKSAKTRQSALTVLARLLRHRIDTTPIIQEALTGNFLNCVDELLAVCIETPSPLLDIVEQAFQSLAKPKQLQAAGMLELKLDNGTLPLNNLNLLISQRLVEHATAKLERSQTIESKALYAKSKGRLGAVLSVQGKDEEATISTKESVDVYKKLVAQYPGKFELDLIQGMNNYAVSLSMLGMAADALIASEEVLVICRSNQELNLKARNSVLARALTSYARHLNAVGRVEEGLAASVEGLKIRRKLASASPLEHEAGLASSLTNCATYLSALGRTDEAMVQTTESLSILRRLNDDEHERFNPSLAVLLSNACGLLAQHGLHKEALASIEESISIYRRLALLKPERFEFELAMSLNNLANELGENGKPEEAAKLAAEIPILLRGFTTVRPERLKPGLADSLYNNSFHLARSGDFEGAFKCASESMGIYEELAGLYPARHFIEFVRSKLMSMLWHWLYRRVVIDWQAVPALPENVSVVERSCFEFEKLYILALTAPSVENFEAVVISWEGLNASQRYILIGPYLITAATADFCCGLEIFPTRWRDDFRDFLNRKSELPCWMVEIANINGFNLTESINS